MKDLFSIVDYKHRQHIGVTGFIRSLLSKGKVTMKREWDNYVAMCRDVLDNAGPAFGAAFIIFITFAYIVLSPIVLPLYFLGKLLERVFGVKGFPG